MKIIKFALPSLLVFSLFLTGCFLGAEKKTEEEKQQEELEKSLEDLGKSIEDVANNISDNVEGNVNDALKNVEEALNDLTKDGDKKATVNFRKLKELMPETLLGLKRNKHKGSTSGMAGFKASVAEAEYEGDDGESVDINIMDAGGVGMALMGMANWSKLEIDEESDDGYKRTTKFDGHRALEECRNNNRRCSLALIAFDRFVISLEGRKVDMDMLKKMVRRMDLDQLVRLAKEAKEEAS